MKAKALQLGKAMSAALFVLLLSMARTKGYAETIGDLKYSLNWNNYTATVTGHKDGTAATGNLTIPSSVNVEYWDEDGWVTFTFTVTTIGNRAFENCSGFTGSLVIPNSVTKIGDYAFRFCSGFTGSLTISNSITSIGVEAFNGCSGFTGNLIIPSTLTNISKEAFRDCSGFTGSLTIPNSVTTIGIYAFSGCSGFTGNLTIPNSVTLIANSAFRGCSGFTGNLTIPNSVTTIGNYAFQGCSGNNLTIPSSLTEIGSQAFGECNFTGCLTIPNITASINSSTFLNSSFGGLNIDITSIPNYIFQNSTVNTISFTGNLTIGNSVTTIGASAFYNCGFTGSLTIGNSVTTIGASAFYNCGFTGGLSIPNSVTTIDSNAFYDCDGFTGNLTIPNSVEYIGVGAFLDCSGFTGTLTIGTGVVSMGVSAFRRCTGITAIQYNATNCLIESGNSGGYSPQERPIFYECENITALTIGNNVQTIPAFAFYNCSGFTGGLTLPNSLTSIGEYAFYNCSGFTGGLTLPNSLTYIDSRTFYNCSGFTGGLTIPNSVLYIYDDAFYGCSGFTEDLTIGNSVILIDQNAFNGCSGFTGNLNIGNSVVQVRNRAFYGCSGFTGNLTIGNAVTTIGDEAFRGCGGFTGDLTIGNSLTTIGENTFYECNGFTGTLTIGQSLDTLPPVNIKQFGHIIVASGNTRYDSRNNCNAIIETSTNTLLVGCSSSVIPYSVTTISGGAFSNCAGLTGELVIPNSVTTIEGCEGDDCWDYYDDRGAFQNCTGLTSLVLGNSLTSIGNYAFYGCTGLTGDLTIPNSVTEIGEDAFYGCSGFNGSLTIGNSVTTISDGAFYGCNGFTELYYNAANCVDVDNPCINSSFTIVVIGENVESLPNCQVLGSYSYWGDNPMQFIKSSAIVPPTVGGSNTFYNINKSTPVIVPCGSLEAYQAASYWSEFTNIREGEYSLTVKANPDYLGTAVILQEPDCNSSHASVKAIPMPGCRFINWTCNEEVVSQNLNYSFDMEEDMVLTANFAAQKRFVGTVSLFWLDPENWEPAGVPADTMSVDIQSDVVIDTDVTVGSVYIHGGHVLTIMPGAKLTVTEMLKTEESEWGESLIVIEDGGQLMHPNDDVYATMKKTVKIHDDTSDNWNLMAYPLTGSGGIWGNIVSNNYDLYYYDEPTHYWNNYKQTDNDFYYLEAGQGYLYANSGTIEMTPNGIQIGEGTGTTGYYPFYTYYEYSISETLFRADELATAGVGTEPLGALCWYATNAPGYEQSNISIWMANVSDNELSYTSHNTSDMTLVYSGSMIPSIGWNEFAFNEGSFSWDGTSNLLICVQRNNGAWNSKIQWQSHETSFAAISYNYRDGSAYDMTSQTYSMSTNYTRPNIVFETVGQLGQSEYHPITLSFAGWLQNGSATVSIPLSYTNGIALAGLNLVGNPYACNAYLLDENDEPMTFFKMNDTGDALVAAQAGTPIKPCEGVFVFCPNDRQEHFAVFTTTALANLGEMQDVPAMLLPIHDLLINQDASGAMSNVTQTITLSSGPNWFSTYLEITKEDLQNALLAALSNPTGAIIKSQDGNSTYRGGRWRDQNFVWDVAKMYMIVAPEDCVITLTGMPINPAEHPITIAPNVSTWIGFPFAESKTPAQVIPAGFAVNGDIIKGMGGNIRYNNGSWRAQGMNILEPGKGYIYNSKSAVSRTLVFPTSVK